MLFCQDDLLPLSVEVIVYFPVGDGHHDNEDPQENYAHHKLVKNPHGYHCSFYSSSTQCLNQHTTGHVTFGEF